MAGGWAHGLWCSTAYISSHYYLVPYNIVPLFNSMSHRCPVRNERP